MTTQVKMPLSDFRASNQGAAGVAATATTTAPAAPTTPPGNNWTPYLVVQDLTACLVNGTGTQAPVPVTLVDGTGSTPIVWQALMGAVGGSAEAIPITNLNIRCNSGYATMAFGTGLGTTAQTSVAFGGYYGGPNFN